MIRAQADLDFDGMEARRPEDETGCLRFKDDKKRACHRISV